MPRRPLIPARAYEGDTEKSDGQALDLSAVAGIVGEGYRSDGDLIPVLQRTQAHYGYLPEEIVGEIARLAGLPASRVYGVITFYAQFSTVPAGRHKVRVCQGTACHVRGGDEVLRAVEKELAVKPGGTTPDLDFGLETVACLGACSFAPVMTVDGQYFAKMKGSRVAPILKEFGGAGVAPDSGPDGGEA
jgi:NADH-quinone oxidoreductase subunit E